MKFVRKKKSCPFKEADFKYVDYKDVELLKRFITERGKIIPRRINGLSSKFQKLVKKAIKRARYMALLPFILKD